MEWVPVIQNKGCILQLRHSIQILMGLLCFLLFQHGVAGDLPYVTTDYNFEVQGAGKLHIYKGLARPGFIKSNN